MLKDLFSNRLFIGALAFFVLMVVSGTLYMQHVQRQTDSELAGTNERLKNLTEKQNPKPTAEAPVDATSQGGHWHGDEWHATPHEANENATPKTPTAPVAEQNTAPKANADLSFLDNPEEAIRRHAEILLDPDRDFLERHHAFWENITLCDKLRVGYYGKGAYSDTLKKLQRELVDDPILRMNGIDPEQLRASVPRKHDPNYVPAPPITLKFGPDTIKRAREALKEGGDTQ